MGRYKGDHWDKTHEAIVSAAAAMVRERGLDDTSVADVMKAVGLTHGGFYAHFDDKASMLVAAIERAFEQSPKNFEVLVGMANTRGDPSLIAKMYLSDAQAADVAGGCAGAALVSELQRQPDALKKAFTDGARRSAGVLGNTKGLSAQQRDPEAWAALALLIGALGLMRAVPDAATRAVIRTQAIGAMQKLASD